MLIFIKLKLKLISTGSQGQSGGATLTKKANKKTFIIVSEFEMYRFPGLQSKNERYAQCWCQVGITVMSEIPK